MTLHSPIEAGLDVTESRTRDAPGCGPAETVVDSGTSLPVFRCEIGSHTGDYSAVGGAAGSVARSLAVSG